MVRLRTLRCRFILCLSGFTSTLFAVHCASLYSPWSCRELDVVGWFYGQAHEREVPYSSCSADRSRRYINYLCKRYQQFEITGSVCKPLCDFKEIAYMNCLPIGQDKVVVILATWGQRGIVLKATKLSIDVNATLGKFLNMNVDEFKEKITMFIETTIGTYGKKSITEPVLDRIVSECDVRGDGVLSGSELQHCGRLIQPELILHTVFIKSNRLINTEIYGSCGELLAAEFASLFVYERTPWPGRVQLALALLDYIQVLEHTAYGTLYLCDLHWSNLGAVKDSSGTTVIKSIDNDKTYFERRVDEIVNISRECEVDYDCYLVACTVECDKTTHTCSRKISSNNLQMVCKYIFWDIGKHRVGLLSKPPSQISSYLNTLKTRCLESGKNTRHIPQDLLHQFYTLLQQSLLGTP